MSTKDNIAFYDPAQLGSFDLGITQINKILPFKSTAGIFLPGSYVKIYQEKELIKTYTIGSGLTLVGTNEAGTEKELQLSLQGNDFRSYQNKCLKGRCSFFVEGDIEIEFELEVKW